jgi:hypothetical protein
MYIATIPNRSSPPAILLRESHREGTKVKSRTLANLTHWPSEKIERLRRVLADEPVALVPGGSPGGSGEFEIQRSLPHGHVVAVLGTLRRLGLERIVAAKHGPERDLVVAMIAARVIDPRSKLATARGLGCETAFTSLGEALEVSDATEDDLYAAMDWLLPRQAAIEKALAARHLTEHVGPLRRNDTYYEGRTCPLGRPQLTEEEQVVDRVRCCVTEGCPVGWRCSKCCGPRR